MKVDYQRRAKAAIAQLLARREVEARTEITQRYLDLALSARHKAVFSQVFVQDLEQLKKELEAITKRTEES